MRKTCNKCKRDLPLGSFSSRKFDSGKTGKMYVCKACDTARRAESRKRSKDEFMECQRRCVALLEEIDSLCHRINARPLSEISKSFLHTGTRNRLAKSLNMLCSQPELKAPTDVWSVLKELATNKDKISDSPFRRHIEANLRKNRDRLLTHLSYLDLHAGD